jgi:magnesium transporter
MQTELQILLKFIQNHPEEAISVIEKSEDQEIAALLQELPIPSSTLVLSQIDRNTGARVLSILDSSKSAQLIEHMSITQSMMLLNSVTEERKSSLLSIIPVPMANTLRRAMTYPKNTAGAHLETHIFTLYKDQIVRDTLVKIKAQHQKVYSNIYVLDRNQVLVGVVDLKTLIISDQGKTIGSVMQSNPFKIAGNMKISALTEINQFHQATVRLPVVDSQDGFLGVLSKETIARLGPADRSTDRQALQASAAMGDLFQIGLSSFLHAGSHKS